MDRTKFYAALRARGSGVFGTSLSQKQVDNLNIILDEIEDADLPLAHAAYVLATPYHEVGPSLEPKTENLNYRAARLCQVWPKRFPTLESAVPYAMAPRKLANHVYGGRMGNTGPDDGWKYRGRGYSQITGRENYTKFATVLDVDLVAYPDRALEPRIAVRILIEGMRRGLFTGKKLSDFDVSGTFDYFSARRIINALDRAGDVADYARAFEKALKAAGYGEGKPASEPKPVPAQEAAPKPQSQPQTKSTGLVGFLIFLVMAAAAAVVGFFTK